MKNEISTNIRNKRKEKGYKQEYVAHQMQMTQANYSKIESGQIEPSINQIEKLAEVFGTTSQEILQGVKEVKIEHHNHANSNNQSTTNGVAYYQQDLERERKMQNETIKSLKQTIQSQQITIETLLKQIQELEKKYSVLPHFPNSSVKYFTESFFGATSQYAAVRASLKNSLLRHSK